MEKKKNSNTSTVVTPAEKSQIKAVLSSNQVAQNQAVQIQRRQLTTVHKPCPVFPSKSPTHQNQQGPELASRMTARPPGLHRHSRSVLRQPRCVRCNLTQTVHSTNFTVNVANLMCCCCKLGFCHCSRCYSIYKRSNLYHTCLSRQAV